MLITCAECGKKLKIADGVAGKKVRCPSCKATVVATESVSIAEGAPSPRRPSSEPVVAAAKSRRKQLDADERDAAPQDDGEMRCPKCLAAAVLWLPPDQYSQYPGYICGKCNTKMRTRGSMALYVIGVNLAVAMLIGGLIFLLWVIVNEVPFGRRDYYVVALLICGGISIGVWSFKQMLLPLPINAKRLPINWSFWIKVAIILGSLIVFGGGALYLFFWVADNF